MTFGSPITKLILSWIEAGTFFPAAQVVRERGTELATPQADRLMGTGEALLVGQVFETAKVQVRRRYSHTARLMISGGKR